MENQGEHMPGMSPSQPLGVYPQPSLPAYPPYQQPYSPTIPPGYQQGYPPASSPMYPAMPAQGLPPSAYPLQSMVPRNRQAKLSIILAGFATLVHLGVYVFFNESIYKTTSRLAEIGVYQHTALLQIPGLLLAIGGVVCGVNALTRAKSQGWNGLIQAIIGVAVAIYVIFSSLGLIIEFQTAASALQSLIP